MRSDTADNAQSFIHQRYNIEFRFDCDCDVRIRIHYFATEKYHQLSQSPLSYKCGCLAAKCVQQSAQSLNSLAQSGTLLLGSPRKCFCLKEETTSVYKRGVNVLFSNPTHVIQPSLFSHHAWEFNLHANYYPIVIECVPVDMGCADHVHVTLAYLDLSHTVLNIPLAAQPHLTTQSSRGVNEATEALTTHSTRLNNNVTSKSVSMGCIAQVNCVYQIKAIKQKQLISGVLFSLQEVLFCLFYLF